MTLSMSGASVGENWPMTQPTRLVRKPWAGFVLAPIITAMAPRRSPSSVRRATRAIRSRASGESRHADAASTSRRTSSGRSTAS